MNWLTLKTKALDDYYPALFLNRLMSFDRRERIHRFLSLAMSVFVVGLIVSSFAPGTYKPLFITIFSGLTAIGFAVWLVSFSLRSFFFYFYFKNIPDNPEKGLPTVSFEVAELLYRSSPQDLLAGFVKSDEGIQVLRRAGIFAADLQKFLLNRQLFILQELISFPENKPVSFTDYAEKLYDANEEFSQFLFAQGIQKKEFLLICDWTLERETAAKTLSRWWSRQHLARIPGIGKAWTYGQLFYVTKYERSLPPITTFDLELHDVYGSAEVQKLESILVRQHEANVFLVGDDIDGKLTLISRLDLMIGEGKAFPELEHKRVIVFDTEILIANSKSKGEFETALLQIMNEVATAGNIILVFPDFPAFMAGAQSVGTDIVSFLDPYFTSPELQIVALSDTAQFHAVLERNPALMQRFDHILIEDADSSNTLKVLENQIIPLEYQTGQFFTFSALEEIVRSADRYFTTGVMPDKAVNLLFELAPLAAAHGKKVIRKEDVEDLVRAKTGIPVGQVTNTERDLLINLEQVLHKRIIGQNEAVDAIANAIRRARSGINNPDRPMASFLFLGPTGVGKTETTKALADVFFGSAAKIERLDMSEYSGSDALPKLIGSYNSSQPGVLANLVREHPYGVLLLDEFEKTTQEVMNLFLQILDEGFFSDMSGKRVNCRNLLIIATSNAGAELIWDQVKKGDDLSHARNLIIDSIIHGNIMKPELLNRFDGVIIFHPLGPENLESIARLQLDNLIKRLATRGFKLVATDELIRYVMKFGTDPKFGARPMARAIQDKVEQIVADKVIRGEAKPGSEIKITQSDLSR
jgi:ATP-dependent Clp protease ATP-binding subunit ClpC